MGVDGRERGLGGPGSRLGGKGKEKKERWKDNMISWATYLQPPESLAPSFLVPWTVSLPTHWAVPSLRKDGVCRSSNGQVWWSRPGHPPPLKAPILALGLGWREKRAHLGVGGCPGQFSKLWLARPFSPLWFPGERKAICKTRQQPEVNFSD